MRNMDGLVKTRKFQYGVIPAEAGIQYFQYVLDAGSGPAWRVRDFLRRHQYGFEGSFKV